MFPSFISELKTDIETGELDEIILLFPSFISELKTGLSPIGTAQSISVPILHK